MKDARQDKKEPPGQVIVCAGPPTCLLEGDYAVGAAMAGCKWCRRITIHEDGTETETGPVRA